MNFGLNANVLTPPFSALVSILMIAGIDWIGIRLAYIFHLLGTRAPAWQRWQAPVLGALFLSILLYPLSLIGITSRWCLQAIGISMSVIGAWHTISIIRKYLDHHSRVSCRDIIPRIKAINDWYLILIPLLMAMGVTSLGAITNADSLEYHIGVAISILNNSVFPVTPEWFHSRVTGSGEVLNALGLSVGAEQFGSLLQFVGVIAITGILIKSELPKNNLAGQCDPRPILAVAAVSAPVLLFLVSSPKPQFLQIAMTSLAVALVFYPSRRELRGKEAIYNYTLVCLLVMTASQAKFSFMLSGGVIGIFSFCVMMRRKLFVSAILIGLFTAILVFGPPVFWKQYHFGGELWESLFSLFPGSWPGYDRFEYDLRNADERRLIFPLSLILPSDLGMISMIIGPGLLITLWLRPGRDSWVWGIVALSLFVAILGAMLNQRASRYFLESFYWLLMAISISPFVIKNGTLLTWIKWPLAVQSIMVIGLWLFGAIMLFPSGLSPSLREKTMNCSANGYSLMEWADKVLPPDAVLLSTHRSIALAPRDVIPMSWSNYVAVDSKEALPYLQRIKDRRGTHILITKDPKTSRLKGCFGKLVAGPFYARVVTRNPFNSGELSPAWIYEFKSGNLPDCATR